jgi:hypothetical protein
LSLNLRTHEVRSWSWKVAYEGVDQAGIWKGKCLLSGFSVNIIKTLYYKIWLKVIFIKLILIVAFLGGRCDM